MGDTLRTDHPSAHGVTPSDIPSDVVTTLVTTKGTQPDVAPTAGTAINILPAADSAVPDTWDMPPLQESSQSSPTPRAERAIGAGELAFLPSVDETLACQDLEATIGVSIDSLLGDDALGNDSHPPATPANSPLPPPLRPGADEDPAGELQMLVDPTEAPAIMEHYRRRYEKER